MNYNYKTASNDMHICQDFKRYHKYLVNSESKLALNISSAILSFVQSHLGVM